MSMLIEHALFFAYVGSAFAVALTAILWGTQSKVLGAGVLLASILISNIVYSLFKAGHFEIRQLAFAYAFLDLMWAIAFIAIARRSSRIERNRWAAYVAALQLAMFAVDLFGASQLDFLWSPNFGLTLNLLLIIAMIVCLIGFTPKSNREAIDVLRGKAFYLWHDLFLKIANMLRPLVRNRGRARKGVRT